MPTYDALAAFWSDYRKLSQADRRGFRAARQLLLEDLRSHPGQFRPSLRVKRLRGFRDIWEMSWAADGRATFHYGEPVREGEPHVVWRRVGSHDIFSQP